MPTIRGKFIAEVEGGMPLRRELKILLWLDLLTERDWLSLEDLDRLRIYLRRSLGNTCMIRLLVSSDNAGLIAQAEMLHLDIEVVQPAHPAEALPAEIDSESLRSAIAVALTNDADCIVAPPELLPYISAVGEHCHLALADPSFLLKIAEVFVRGFDIPWSFSYPVIRQTFATFYLLSERSEIFEPGFEVMFRLSKTNEDFETIEAGRTLIFNRLANLCFTRDRLLFYAQQKEAALRQESKKQGFAFELAYYLNFYYLLLYGAFDNAALLVNGACKLGLKSREVGATYKTFLDALQQSSAPLHTIFTKQSTIDLLDRFGALRHYAAHRGLIAPSKVIEAPENDLTDAEIDVAIRKSGKFAWLLDLPDGPQKEALLGMVRFTTKAEIYEEKTVAKDVVFVEVRGKRFMMHPLSDITWNFERTITFLHEVFGEVLKLLA